METLASKDTRGTPQLFDAPVRWRELDARCKATAISIGPPTRLCAFSQLFTTTP